MNSELIKKYNIAAPRYTSYPTVPYWDTDNWTEQIWIDSIKKAYHESSADGISIYIHLPFCESLCTYCGCNTRITKNHAVEVPYIKAVLKEWKMYCAILNCKPRVKEIHLGGGTPTFFKAEHLKMLIEGILESSELTSDAEFSFEAHPANTEDCHLQTLYYLGFRRLSLGIQDFDPKVQEIINRKQSIEQVSHITEYARKIGYSSINYDLIYGLPLQTLNGVTNTISEVVKLMPDRIAYYSYAHVPWIKPGQRKFTEDDLPEDNEKRMLYERGCELLNEARYENIGMDHFALRSDSLYKALIDGKLHRNFMGYTHQYTKLSLGLGVSSISDSWFSFAQNTKTVEIYQKMIDSGELPLLKGHHLTENDLESRREILNIMCKGYTDMTKTDSRLVKRLLPLRKDKLVDFNYHTLYVTSTGKSFLRNICMAFDERLWNSPSADQKFSKAV